MILGYIESPEGWKASLDLQKGWLVEVTAEKAAPSMATLFVQVKTKYLNDFFPVNGESHAFRGRIPGTAWIWALNSAGKDCDGKVTQLVTPSPPEPGERY